MNPVIRYERLRESLRDNPLPFEADEVILDELLKFLAIRRHVEPYSTSSFQVAMRSSPMDDLWHQWLLHTSHYMTTCQDALGKYVHHAPYVGTDRDDWIDRHELFRSMYHMYFGPVPDVWGSWDSIVREWECMKSGPSGS